MKLLFTSFFLLIVGLSNAQTLDTNWVDGRIYVRTAVSSTIDLANYNNSNVALNAIITTYGVSNMWAPFPLLSSELDRTFEIEFTQQAQVDNLILELELLSDIEYAEKKPLMKTSYIPNDVDGGQWGLTKINAFQAWDVSTGSANIKVAIVDNAVSTVHEDLQANIYVNTGEIPGNGIDDDLNGYTDDVTGYDVADSDG